MFDSHRWAYKANRSISLENFGVSSWLEIFNLFCGFPFLMIISFQHRRQSQQITQRNKICYFLLRFNHIVYGAVSATRSKLELVESRANDSFSPVSVFTFRFQSVLDGSQESIQCLAVCTCDIIVLFVYCASGELIADACDISDAVYQLRWYNYDEKLKYTIRTVIARSQKPYTFSSCSFLNCSFQTFAQVRSRRSAISSWWSNLNEIYFQIVQKAASAFAMLRSIWIATDEHRTKRRLYEIDFFYAFSNWMLV